MASGGAGSSQRPSAFGKGARSYRQLLEDLAEAESSAQQWRQEGLEARGSLGPMRSDLAAARATATEFELSEASLRMELEQLHDEAASFWVMYEAPLQRQEEALQEAARHAAGLGQWAEVQRADAEVGGRLLEQLHQENMALRLGAADARQACVQLEAAVEAGEKDWRGLALHSQESLQLVEALDEAAAARRRQRVALEVEAAAEKEQVDAAWLELQDTEQRSRETESWWRSERGTWHEGLTCEVASLEDSLERAELVLDARARESAQWRDRAYRSELALRTLQREHVPGGGLRSLREECTLYAHQQIHGIVPTSFD